MLRNLLHPLSRYRCALRGRMLAVRLDITTRCNLRCRMCHYLTKLDEPKYDMEPALFRRIADQIFPYTERAVLSCRFEPYMSPYVDEIIAIADQGPCQALGMVTNATLLNERRIEALVKCSALWSVAVSVDGGIRETYERIRVNAKWDQVVGNLEALARLKKQQGRETPYLQINTVSLRPSMKELPQIVDLAARVGAKLLVVIPCAWDDPDINEGIASWEEVMPMVEEARAKARQYGITLTLPPSLGGEEPKPADPSSVCYSTHCEAPWSMLQINANGDIYPCGFIEDPIGNIAKDDFADIWNNTAYLELRRSLALGQLSQKCRQCRGSQLDDMEHRTRKKPPIA